MMKTTLIIFAVLIGAAAASAQVAAPAAEPLPETAEQVILNLPPADTVIAQFSYFELSHDKNGFSLSVTDKTAAFVDVEFPGDLHIRIGF